MRAPRTPVVMMLMLVELGCAGPRSRSAPDGGVEATLDLVQLGAAACARAGGTCGRGSATSVVIDSITCDPKRPQVSCQRDPSDCGDAATLRCCSIANGKPTAIVATCDRGYPTCSTVNGEWLSAGDCADTTQRRRLPAAELPSRWPGAVSVRDATRWACAEAGGVTTPADQPCTGARLPFGELGVAQCCAPDAVCPEAVAGTECCDPKGAVVAKRCLDGYRHCDPMSLQLGTLREVARGTCAATGG